MRSVLLVGIGVGRRLCFLLARVGASPGLWFLLARLGVGELLWVIFLLGYAIDFEGYQEG